ncbi:MAG: sortase [Ardenticatenia bacterium]|nr:sortase [Ardenticatenia bacterium]
MTSRQLSTLFIVGGSLLLAAGLFLWGYQVLWPVWQLARLDADGDGVVLAETLEGLPTRVLKPTFTPPPAGRAGELDAPPPLLPAFVPEDGDEESANGKSTGTAVPGDDPAPPEPTPTPLPTFTPRPDPTATPSAGGPPPADRPPDRIVIPSIGVDAPVEVMGWITKRDANGNPYSEWLVPDYAAGWHKNSALPGHVGNTVLSGHNNIKGEVFRYLADVKPGDEVVLYVGETAYRYIVTEKYIVREKGVPYEQRLRNARFMAPTDDERVTLISCWPYETNTHRVIVIARPAHVVEALLQQDAS